MTMPPAPAPEGCPPAYNGCTCPCHRTPGMFHLVACCMPSAEENKREYTLTHNIELPPGAMVIAQAALDAAMDIPPKRYGVTGSLGASHPHLANYILVDETGDGIWVMHAEWAAMKKERDEAVAGRAQAMQKLQEAVILSDTRYQHLMACRQVKDVMEKGRDELLDEIQRLRARTNIQPEFDVRKVVIGDNTVGTPLYAKNAAEVAAKLEQLRGFLRGRDMDVAERDAQAGDYPHIAMTLNEAGVPEYYAATGQSPEHLTPHKRVKWLVGQREEYRKERDDAVAKLNDALKANQELTGYIATAEANGREALVRTNAVPPVPITIQCPKCAHWHVDEDKEVPYQVETSPGVFEYKSEGRNYAKHPHSTHLCAHCNHTWNPFPIKMPTVGVAPKLTSKEEDQWSTAAADLARRLGAEIGALKKELEKALAGPWRPDLRKERDAALAEIGALKKDANDAHAILTKHLVVRKWFPNGSEGAGVDRGIYERVQDMAIMLGNERADADRIKRERDEALQGKAHTASDCDMARRERDVALQQRDEARELCRSAKADVTTLRGLLKDAEHKIQAMVQANAASAWGIAERDKMEKALRDMVADRDLARGTITELRQELDLLTGNLQVIKAQRDNFMEGYDKARENIAAVQKERDETARLVNDVCQKLGVPMMSTHDRVQRLADWYLAVRDEHESLVKERDQIREGYRELNSRHVALVEHWAPLKGSASEQALPDAKEIKSALTNQIVHDQHAIDLLRKELHEARELCRSAKADVTTLRGLLKDEEKKHSHLAKVLDDRARILTEIDTLANNAGASTREGTIQKVRWLVSELGQFKGMHEKLCKEVEAEKWAVLQALQQPGVTEDGSWYTMTRLQQIQALVRDRDAWRSTAGYKAGPGEPLSPLDQVAEDSKRRHAIADEVIGLHLERTMRAGQLSSSGAMAIGAVPAVGNATGERPHPTADRFHIVTDELAIMVHLHLAGSGWATDQDLERALGYWAMSRYCPRIGTITRGGAMDDLAKAVDAWAARKVRDPKGVRP